MVSQRASPPLACWSIRERPVQRCVRVAGHGVRNDLRSLLRLWGQDDAPDLNIEIEVCHRRGYRA
jgi:hypothetical protein